MLEMLLGVILFGTASFILSWYITRKLIPMLKQRGLVGTDMYKLNKPPVAKEGGIAILLTFWLVTIFVSIISIYYTPLRGLNSALYYVSLTMALASFIGLLTDLLDFSWTLNTVLPIICAIPLLNKEIIKLSYINLPLLGNINLGNIYPIALLIGAIGAPNAVNLIAGFNGMSMGVSAIIVCSIAIMITLTGKTSLLISALILLGTILGFLVWNKYPARVLPGDVGRFGVGGAIFALAVLSKLEFWVAMLFAIHFLNLGILIKNIKYEKKEKFGYIRKDGRLSSRYGSTLPKLLAKKFHPTEKQLVGWFWIAQICVGIVVIGLYYISTKLIVG